jgi:hypothetical protein
MELEGVRGVWGVRRDVAASERLWQEGVLGKSIEFLVGEIDLDERGTGKGMANSPGAARRFTGDFDGDGDGGHSIKLQEGTGTKWKAMNYAMMVKDAHKQLPPVH